MGERSTGIPRRWRETRRRGARPARPPGEARNLAVLALGVLEARLQLVQQSEALREHEDLRPHRSQRCRPRTRLSSPHGACESPCRPRPLPLPARASQTAAFRSRRCRLPIARPAHCPTTAHRRRRCRHSLPPLLRLHSVPTGRWAAPSHRLRRRSEKWAVLLVQGATPPLPHLKMTCGLPFCVQSWLEDLFARDVRPLRRCSRHSRSPLSLCPRESPA